MTSTVIFPTTYVSGRFDGRPQRGRGLGLARGEPMRPQAPKALLTPWATCGRVLGKREGIFFCQRGTLEPVSQWTSAGCNPARMSSARQNNNNDHNTSRHWNLTQYVSSLFLNSFLERSQPAKRKIAAGGCPLRAVFSNFRC